MTKAPVGISFRETMSGGFALGATAPTDGRQRGEHAGTELSMHATVTIPDLERFLSDPDHQGNLTGSIDFAVLGEGIQAAPGVFNLFAPSDDPAMRRMVYELPFEHAGQAYYLAGLKKVRHDRGFDVWPDTTTLWTTLHKGSSSAGEIVGAGVLRLGIRDLVRLTSTMRVIGATSAADKAAAMARFGRFFLAELWDSYAKFLPKES